MQVCLSFLGKSFLGKYPAYVIAVNCWSDIFSSQAIAPKSKGIDKINLDLVRTWYNQCIKHHEKCKEDFSALWYPTRLLYLGSQSREVKLIISDDDPPSGPYMSLSHRWGSQKYTKLESSTIIQLKTGIDVDSLLQVFQDAIEIARSLGINYLWIDALCIKQDPDDPSDWGA